MPFVDTNIHLTTNVYNFDIKCHSNSEGYDQTIFLGLNLGVVFQTHKVLWGRLAGPSLRLYFYSMIIFQAVSFSPQNYLV